MDSITITVAIILFIIMEAIVGVFIFRNMKKKAAENPGKPALHPLVLVSLSAGFSALLLLGLLFYYLQTAY